MLLSHPLAAPVDRGTLPRAPNGAHLAFRRMSSLLRQLRSGARDALYLLSASSQDRRETRDTLFLEHTCKCM